MAPKLSAAPSASRVLPVLTEVVHVQPQVLASMLGAEPTGESTALQRSAMDESDCAGVVGPTLEGVAANVLQQLSPALQQQLAQAIAQLVQDELLGVTQRLRQQVMLLTRQAVAEALARGTAVPKPGDHRGNP